MHALLRRPSSWGQGLTIHALLRGPLSRRERLTIHSLLPGHLKWGLGRLKAHFVGWPLELGLGAHNPRFVA